MQSGEQGRIGAVVDDVQFASVSGTVQLEAWAGEGAILAWCSIGGANPRRVRCAGGIREWRRYIGSLSGTVCVINLAEGIDPYGDRDLQQGLSGNAAIAGVGTQCRRVDIDRSI